MVAKPPPIEEARLDIQAVEIALMSGLPPTVPAGSTRGRSAITTAGEARGVPRQTFQSRVGRPGKPGSYQRVYGIGPDWSLYAEPTKPQAPVDPPPADPVDLRRVRDEAARLRAQLAERERAEVSAADLRRSVFRLAEAPLEPPAWSGKPAKGRAAPEAIILFVSDVHMGEVIDLAQMGGRNSYNREIARTRLARLFATVVSLGTEHWSGPPPGVIYLVLGGDLISGEIHEELAKTNDLLAIPAVRELSECLVAGINLLLASFKCEVRVISVPGNHGRVTRKPEAKRFALDSYDTLVAWCVESWFAARGEKRVSFSAPVSGDALVNICGWHILFTHGDRIGSRGGAGFVGPAAVPASSGPRRRWRAASNGWCRTMPPRA